MKVTMMERAELISRLLALLNEFTEIEDEREGSPPNSCVDDSAEFLSIKECTQVTKGISEYTIRLLVSQKKIPYVRTGRGKCGKILINKKELLEYFNVTV